MPTVTTDDGVSISYQIQGNGPVTLMFLHGWAGSGAYFEEVVGELDLGALRVVAMDFRGHGESGPPAAAFDMDRLARDVWAVADAVGATQVVLAGFSMSGKFAQYVATTNPNRVAGLVLIAGFPPSEIPFPQEVVREWAAAAGQRELFRALVTPFITEPVDPLVFDRFLSDAVKVSGAVLEQTLQTCITASFSDRVHMLRMPTLIVGGRRDPIFPAEAVAHLAGSLPCARGICLECSHEIPLERPRELAHVIEAFVAGLGSGCRTSAGASPVA